jgi:hypothetical protein
VEQGAGTFARRSNVRVKIWPSHPVGEEGVTGKDGRSMRSPEVFMRFL